MTRLKDIFDIEYGNQIDLNKLEITSSKDGIRFISRSSENLGFQCYVKPNSKFKLFKKGNITVTLGGSYLLSSFVQPGDFYTAQNIKVLTPKIELSEPQKFFYCYLITQNRFRFTSHGREANKTLDELPIPLPEKLPSWIDEVFNKIKIPSNKKLNKIKLNLNEREWSWIKLNDIFCIKGTKSHTKEEISLFSYGKYPYVVTSSLNNGVEGFYEHYTELGNVLTIDSATIGSCFYQSANFSASDHVEKLIPKFEINIYIAIFLVTIINLEQYRYGYGRKFAQTRIKKTEIKLPVTKSGEPDWQFMEDYIKSLPYSKSL